VGFAAAGDCRACSQYNGYLGAFYVPRATPERRGPVKSRLFILRAKSLTTSYQLRKLGKSCVNVRSVSRGTVRLAAFKTKVDYPDEAAHEGRIRCFDAAPMYGFGNAEYYLRHAIRKLSIRGNVIVRTKVGRVPKPASRPNRFDTVHGIEWIGPPPFRYTYDYSYEGIMRSHER